MGKNGAGKTTLIKLMLNLLVPDTGTILLEGKALNDYNNKLYNKVRAVLEGSRNAYYYMTSEQNIDYFGSLMNIKSDIIKSDSIHLLKKFDLYDHRNKNVGNFSRGMQQKLSIILSLIGSPEYLFLDEPTLGLDLVSKKELISNLKQLMYERNLTIILTSHQSDVIENLADKVYYLELAKPLKNYNSVDDFKKAYSTQKTTIRFDGKILLNGEQTTKVLEIYKDDEVNRYLTLLIENNCKILDVEVLNNLEESIYTAMKEG